MLSQGDCVAIIWLEGGSGHIYSKLPISAQAMGFFGGKGSKERGSWASQVTPEQGEAGRPLSVPFLWMPPLLVYFKYLLLELLTPGCEFPAKRQGLPHTSCPPKCVSVALQGVTGPKAEEYCPSCQGAERSLGGKALESCLGSAITSWVTSGDDSRVPDLSFFICTTVGLFLYRSRICRP